MTCDRLRASNALHVGGEDSRMSYYRAILPLQLHQCISKSTVSIVLQLHLDFHVLDANLNQTYSKNCVCLP